MSMRPESTTSRVYPVSGRGSRNGSSRRATATGCLLAGLAAVGAIRATPSPLSADHIGRLDVPAVAHVTGRLAAEPVTFAVERTRLLLDVERVDDEPRTGRLPVTLYGAAPPLTEGQRVAGEMRLNAAAGFRNPGGFDYGEFLRREAMPVVASARVDRLTVLDDPSPRSAARPSSVPSRRCCAPSSWACSCSAPCSSSAMRRFSTASPWPRS